VADPIGFGIPEAFLAAPIFRLIVGAGHSLNFISKD
jgi:hypothetical protein